MTLNTPTDKDALRALQDALLLLGGHVEPESDGQLHGFDDVDASLDALASALTRLFPLPELQSTRAPALEEVLESLAEQGLVDEEVVLLARTLTAHVRRTRYFSQSKQEIGALEEARKGLHRCLMDLFRRAERSARGV